ncbi:hypothetical protein D6745_05180 [Candidatus Woesearchaeota archaeon]|nr:MAG: hypothetical protein D6745_05180 [Candidatus Woesearchaeota archaeon]
MEPVCKLQGNEKFSMRSPIVPLQLAFCTAFLFYSNFLMLFKSRKKNEFSWIIVLNLSKVLFFHSQKDC